MTVLDIDATDFTSYEALLEAAAWRWAGQNGFNTGGRYTTSENQFLWAAERAWCQLMDRLFPVIETPEPVEPPYRKAKIPELLRWQVWERDDFRCRHCGDRQLLTVDHVHPEVLGGELTLDNLQTLCKTCNSRKGARIETDDLVAP